MTPEPETASIESVDEALAPHAPDGTSVGSPGCYALEIDVPDIGQDKLAHQWLEHYEATPPYLAMLADCDRVLYVGAAKDVRARIEDHLASEKRVATLPSIWGVSEVVDVEWFGTTKVQEAFEYEQRFADELNARYPGAYVHTR